MLKNTWNCADSLAGFTKLRTLTLPKTSSNVWQTLKTASNAVHLQVERLLAGITVAQHIEVGRAKENFFQGSY